MLFGSVAAMVHTQPFYTRDVDIGVATESDAEFMHVFRRLASLGRTDGHAVIIHDTPVEIFPVDISPIIQDALSHANRKRVEGIVVKVAPAEHLLLEALRVFRDQDKARIFLLRSAVNIQTLNTLFERLDPDGTLLQRYERLIG